MARNNRDKNNQQSEQLRKLFVGGLTLETTEQDLRDFYGKWGTIEDAVVMMNKMTNRSRCFGFITYSELSMVDTAQANRPHVINNREVETKRATPREESDNRAVKEAVNRLFIGGMKKELTEEALKDYFSQYGNITEIEIPKNRETGEPRGFCFITFDDYDPVDKASLIRRHTINNISFDVMKAIGRDQMSKAPRRDESRGGRGGARGYGNSYSQEPRGRSGGRGPPPSQGPPQSATYYNDYPSRYNAPTSYGEDPYYNDRYAAPAPASAAAYGQYDDPYGNGWSDPNAVGYGAGGYGAGQPAFGSYEDQGYSSAGPMRHRGGYVSGEQQQHRSGPYQAPPRSRGPAGAGGGPRR